MPAPQSSSVRFPVQPGDVPPEKAARRMHLTPAQFDSVKQRLFSRGFPPPDPDTGMYDLEAIDRWRRLRNSKLFPELTGQSETDESVPVAQSMGDRFREAKGRQRNG